MRISSFATAIVWPRVRLVPDIAGHAPIRLLVFSGLVLMAAIAIGTGLTIAKFRESAIETGRQGLESGVLLLARHFDRQFDDFAVLQKGHRGRTAGAGDFAAGHFQERDGNPGNP